MAQAAFLFNTPAAASTTGAALQAVAGRRAPAGLPADPAATPLDTTGWAIGHDHAHYRLTPPLAHLHAHNPVRQGWQAGRAVYGERTLKATPAVRQWLALRLAAWQGGQGFDDVQVTPHFLAQLQRGPCPVTRQNLGVPGLGTTDMATPADGPAAATLHCLNTHAAYAAGNLVVLHPRVAEARGALDAPALLALAERLSNAGPDEATELRGMGAAEWGRLAVLASFATPLPHARAACLPLAVLPPNRLRVINPAQALQVMLTLQFAAAGYARRLLGLAALVPGSDARQAFQIFMHTLLSRRLAAGPQADAAAVRQALEDSWADPLVNRRWQRLALRLTAAECEQLLARAAQRGLVVGGARWASAEAATEGWALPVATGATARATTQATAQAGAQASATPPSWARPGSARSLGSQNVASCAGATASGSPQ